MRPPTSGPPRIGRSSWSASRRTARAAPSGGRPPAHLSRERSSGRQLRQLDEEDRHGFLAIRSSSTAAFRIDDSSENSRRTVRELSSCCLPAPRTAPATSSAPTGASSPAAGRCACGGGEPSARACSRRRSARRARRSRTPPASRVRDSGRRRSCAPCRPRGRLERLGLAQLVEGRDRWPPPGSRKRTR